MSAPPHFASMSPETRRIILLHPMAPPKPAVGQACNGCGVCCMAEPCPVGMVLSLRRRGACRRLRWDDAAQRYRCGLLQALAPGARAGWLSRTGARLTARWIAAGQGCDAEYEATSAHEA